MPSLYELTESALALQNLLEDGEIDEQVFIDTMEGLGVDDKIENICKIIRNLEGSAQMFKAEKDRMAERQKTAENGVKKLKDNLLAYLEATHTAKVQAGLFTVSKRSAKSVNILYEDALPEEFLIPQPATIDRTAIGKIIREGGEVPGAELVEKPYVMIR